MAKERNIAICADDYGLSHGVSVGILKALDAGRLTAVSALVTGPRWPAMGRQLARGGVGEEAEIFPERPKQGGGAPAEFVRGKKDKGGMAAGHRCPLESHHFRGTVPDPLPGNSLSPEDRQIKLPGLHRPHGVGTDQEGLTRHHIPAENVDRNRGRREKLHHRKAVRHHPQPRNLRLR